MKELSIKEKAKRYDEALEIAKEINNEQQSQPFNVMTRVFPELKESEDENIRKELIAYHRSMAAAMNGNRPCVHEAWIAWLEKQGDKEKFIKKELGCIQGYREEAIRRLKEIEKQGERKPVNDTDEDIVEAVKDTSILDMVEPKFKVGDWITNGRYNKLIVGVNSDWPFYMFKDGTSERIKDVDKKYHLWTIQDAKDGDVLFSNCCGTFICEYYNEYETKSYCRFDGNRFIPQKESGWDATILKPATKEQRDLLFQKMKEVGYEWDAEKKEKKKIESKFNVGDWVVIKTNGNEHVEQIIRIEYFANGHPQYILSNGLWFGNGTEARLWSIADAKDGDVLVEDSCIFIIQKLGDNSTAAKTYCTLYNDGDFDDGSILYFDIDSTKPATKEQRDTLMKAMADAGWEFDFEKKELKKIEQKLAWSEEDEKILNTTISFLSEYAAKGYENAVMCIDWLKSLKQRIGG